MGLGNYASPRPTYVAPARNSDQTFLVKFCHPDGHNVFVKVRAESLEKAKPMIREAYRRDHGGVVPKVGTDARYGIINFD